MLKSQVSRFTHLARLLGAAMFDKFSGSKGSYLAPRRPVGKALRNPEDPHQAARIEAARRRREHRGAKAQAHYDRCILNNPCRG